MCLLQLAVTFFTCFVSKTSVPKHIFPQSENNKEKKKRTKIPFIPFSFRSFSTFADEVVTTVTTYVTRRFFWLLRLPNYIKMIILWK